jgi:CHAT domain-containing protein
MRSRISAISVTLGLAFLLGQPGLQATHAASVAGRDAPLDLLRAGVAQAPSPHERVVALWKLSDALIVRGDPLAAERELREAAAISTMSSQNVGSAIRLGAVLAQLGRVDEARTRLAVADSAAGALDSSDRLRLYQARAYLAVRLGEFSEAEQAFAAEADAAHAVLELGVESRARINALRARMDRKEIADLEPSLHALGTEVGALPPGEQRAVLLLAIGDLFERAVEEFRSPLEQRAHAYDAFSLARGEATQVSTRAYAAGLLGGLYEDEGRSEEALRLTYEAIGLAESIDAQTQLYRWEWQAGHIEQKLGRPQASARAFDRALFTLSTIRGDVLQSSRQAFNERVEPVYLDYADAHLREAATLAVGSTDEQLVLRDVRDKLESLKQLEVQDYFDSTCAVSNAVDPSHGTSIPGVAIVYPILLADRTEVLIEIGGTLRRFSTPVSRGELTATIRELRLVIERPSAGDEYRAPAQALYGWLLADAKPWLASQKVNTLVFVPSGPLRTIPLGVLLDGNQFLIEHYAIATTPAITLIPTLESPGENRVLVAGLTKSVQGYAGLPSVGAEIHAIGLIYPTESLEDEKFRLASIRTDLAGSGFSVAHLATHGEFSADHRQSFILTYDSRLTMDGLQAALGKREEPLDLLVLSACNTAAGDDRAALGLAGVAVQSGAKTALASLWSISDEATASLMTFFYKNLKAGTETKAESLRGAQLALLRTPGFGHPSYWAPYLLIGSWL